MSDGSEVTVYHLKNSSGTGVDIIDWGAAVTAMQVPDRSGELHDVVLGFADPLAYEWNAPGFGIIAGRYANRIGNAEFELDGRKYPVSANNSGCCLHGGERGFGRRLWKGRIADGALELTLESADGDQGFPGNCKVRVIYHWTEHNELAIDYFAETDRDTVINLTNHTYFNLDSSDLIYDHEIFINAETYTAVDERLVPTGEIRSLLGTHLDLTAPRRIGDILENPPERFSGYDHNYIFRGGIASRQIPCAAAYAANTGIMMELLTTEPAVQFYSANFLNGEAGRSRIKINKRHGGFCMEAQHYPDSPNQPGFPSTRLNAGETYRQTTIYRFLVR
jgi:aldose 1-epimerase